MTNSKMKALTLPDGKLAFGIEVDFKVQQEEWNLYSLSNGTKLRAKTVITKIWQVVDEDGNQLYGEDGDPIYFVSSNFNLVASEALEDEVTL